MGGAAWRQRTFYEIFEDDEIDLIHRVQHRRDAYRPRPTTRPRAFRARNAEKPCETVRGDEYKTPGQSTYGLVTGVGALHSQRRGHRFESRHLHHGEALIQWDLLPELDALWCD